MVLASKFMPMTVDLMTSDSVEKYFNPYTTDSKEVTTKCGFNDGCKGMKASESLLRRQQIKNGSNKSVSHLKCFKKGGHDLVSYL